MVFVRKTFLTMRSHPASQRLALVAMSFPSLGGTEKSLDCHQSESVEGGGAGVSCARAISEGDFPVSSSPSLADSWEVSPDLPAPTSASSTTTGRPSPELAVYSLNKLRQLSYLPLLWVPVEVSGWWLGSLWPSHRERRGLRQGAAQ